MFYNYQYLNRRTGRFGVIWLAATKPSLLDKREIYKICISKACEDITDHILGLVRRHEHGKRRLFSLYLSSMLMYGSARLLLLQWNLFIDEAEHWQQSYMSQMKQMKANSELVIMDKPHVLMVDVDMDANPFFGTMKDTSLDIEDLLAKWDSTYVGTFHPIQDIPQRVTPEIGSPHSVSDPREIQIPDRDLEPFDRLLPGEQDLSGLDFDNMAMLQQAEEIYLSPSELLSPGVSRVLRDSEITQTLPTRHLDEVTPAVKNVGRVPGTPQKRKRQHSPTEKKRKRDVDGPETDLRQGRRSETDLNNLESSALLETSTGVSSLTEQVLRKDSKRSALFVNHGEPISPMIALPEQVLGPDGEPITPVVSRHERHPPGIQLTPVEPCESPARRRRIQPLIIDTVIQISTKELRNRLATSYETSRPMVLPEVKKKWHELPGSKITSLPDFLPLWKRNCKFGLRVFESETSSSSSSSSPFANLRQRQQDEETPLLQRFPKAETSVPLSMERIRDVSTASAKGGEASHSLVAHSEDESSVQSRKSDEAAEIEKTEEELAIMIPDALPTLAEEQEHLSPIFSPPSDLGTEPQPFSPQSPPESGYSPKTQLLIQVKRMRTNTDDLITFRMICPPLTTNRHQAASMFRALCDQVAKKNLIVKQEKPFGDIFIWLPGEIF